jgi:hypothetical protein
MKQTDKKARMAAKKFEPTEASKRNRQEFTILLAKTGGDFLRCAGKAP